MTNGTKLIARLAGALLLLSGATQAFADAPTYVRVRSISYAGSGCPAGSVAQNISPDRMAFTLLFDQYIAEIGPGIPLANSRRNCQILTDLDFPQGWSYSVLTVDYRGYANLEAGVTGQQQSAYYFQGSSTTARLATTFNGPTARDYQIRDTLGLSAVVWSPCGAQRALNINTQVRLSSASRFAQGMLTTDSIDGQVKQIYGFQWRRCGAPSHDADAPRDSIAL